jgi:ribose transport system substrate-binding protein
VASLGVVALLLAGCSSNSDTTPTESAPTTSEAPAASETPAATDSATAAPESPDYVDFREAAPGSGDGMKLGFITLGDSIPFSKLVTDGMVAQAKAAGADLIVCDSAHDAAKALTCVQNFKTQGVQGYLNFQPDSAAAAGICEAGPQVPVIAVDIEQQPCQDAFMGANNAKAGFIGGESMGQYFKDNFDCKYDAFVSLEQPAAGVVNDYRMGGYRDGFESVCGTIENLQQVDTGGVTDQARTVFADVLTTLPDAKHIVVVAINDDSALGALAAARTANRDGNIYISAQGADPSAVCEIATNPNWVGDTAYFPERYGEIGIQYLIDMVNGKEVPKSLYIKHEFVTADNIGDYYDTAACK